MTPRHWIAVVRLQGERQRLIIGESIVCVHGRPRRCRDGPVLGDVVRLLMRQKVRAEDILDIEEGHT